MEVGPLPGAPPRPTSIPLPLDSLEYAPTTGIKALREAVANLYNVTYRQNKTSKYTYENVCIVPGDRSGLSRLASVIGDVYTSYHVPDYTVYDPILSAFKRPVPVQTILDPKTKYSPDIDLMKKDIQTVGLGVILASNPRNPTGQEFVQLGREGTTIILDEIYSWYIYPDNDNDFGKSISSAEYVEDVNQDSIIILDGLTKNWRLPGWRVCWVLGPKNLITALSQSGSFLDGGANHPMQLAAVPLLDAAHVLAEKHFKHKRDHVLKRLKEIGLDVDIPPCGTFYIWLNFEKLPAPLNNGLIFFQELSKEKTIIIPGVYFDINPAYWRNLFHSAYHHFVRLSFGPPLDDLEHGLDVMERVVKKAKKGNSGMDQE